MRFAKAHACGNDFLIIADSEMEGRDYADAARWLCARTTGVGADGIEFLTLMGERSGRIRLYNADGSVAEISGNGTRCVAAWIAYQNRLGAAATIELATDAGLRTCEIQASEETRFRIRTGMGVPRVHAQSVRLANGAEISGAVVSTGNPHFVIFVEDPGFSYRGRNWQQLGAEICVHADFPQGTNVEFVRLHAANGGSPNRLEIRIFERGVGPTSSSGTGTSASAAAAIALRGAAGEVEVVAPGGAQTVRWPASEAELELTGPAEVIATGECFPALVTVRGPALV